MFTSRRQTELSDWTESLAHGQCLSFYHKHSRQACCGSAEHLETLKCFSLGPWWLSAPPRTRGHHALAVLLRPTSGAAATPGALPAVSGLPPPYRIASHVDSLNSLLSFLGVMRPLLSMPALGGHYRSQDTETSGCTEASGCIGVPLADKNCARLTHRHTHCTHAGDTRAHHLRDEQAWTPRAQRDSWPERRLLL